MALSTLPSWHWHLGHDEEKWHCKVAASFRHALLPYRNRYSWLFCDINDSMREMSFMFIVNSLFFSIHEYLPRHRSSWSFEEVKLPVCCRRHCDKKLTDDVATAAANVQGRQSEVYPQYPEKEMTLETKICASIDWPGIRRAQVYSLVLRKRNMSQILKKEEKRRDSQGERDLLSMIC